MLAPVLAVFIIEVGPIDVESSERNQKSDGFHDNKLFNFFRVQRHLLIMGNSMARRISSVCSSGTGANRLFDQLFSRSMSKSMKSSKFGCSGPSEGWMKSALPARAVIETNVSGFVAILSLC